MDPFDLTAVLVLGLLYTLAVLVAGSPDPADPDPPPDPDLDWQDRRFIRDFYKTDKWDQE